MGKFVEEKEVEINGHPGPIAVSNLVELSTRENLKTPSERMNRQSIRCRITVSMRRKYTLLISARPPNSN